MTGLGAHGTRGERGTVLRAPSLLACLLLAACPMSASRLLDKADDLEREHAYAKAQNAYRDALRRLGDDDTAPGRELRTRGLAHLADLCYLDLRDLKCAAEAYRRLIENYPDAPETFPARTHFAEMLRDRMNDITGAIAQYKALATAYPGKAGSDDFQYQVAQGYFMLRDYPQARSEARGLLERFDDSPRAPQARFLIASCYELEGQRPEAVKAFEDLLARDPDGELSAPKARVALAKLLEQQGERKKALLLLEHGATDPAEAAFVAEERRRLAHQLREEALSRQAIFGEKPSAGEGEGGGEGGEGRHGRAAKVGAAAPAEILKAEGHDPFGGEGDPRHSKSDLGSEQ